MGLRHGFLYLEVIDSKGGEGDEMIVRSFASKDNWATHQWDAHRSFKITIP